jgi:hypothetical protein
MVKKTMSSHKTAAAPKPLDLDVRPGQSVELLKELHILTREGKLNQDSRRKLKQVYHLFQFIEKLLKELPVSDTGPTLADHGAGKSYLGFIIYDLFFKALGQGTIYGIETRSELVESSRQLAERLGFERMQFLNLSVAESAHSDALPEKIDVVTALHACDTATDDAIAFGLQKKAQYMVLVPCCQAELAHQRVALPLLRVTRLPSDRDRTRGLGTQHEKRADPGQVHRPEKARIRRAPAGTAAGVRCGSADGRALPAGVEHRSGMTRGSLL